MQRYFAEIKDNKAILSSDDNKHLLKVMRSEVGEIIEIVSNNKIYHAKLTSINPLNIEIIDERDENHELNFSLVLIASILKGEKMDLVIQKATEIGVKEIILLRSEHSIGKIKNEDVAKKLERYSKIAKEAAQQSKRNIIPVIEKVIDFKAIKDLKGEHKLIGAVDDNINVKGFVNEIYNIKENETLYMMIGPEGGFSKEEISFAKNNGFTPVSFGKRVLRAETACLASLSIISCLYEGK